MIKFIKRDDIEEYDVEDEIRKYSSLAQRSGMITNINWKGTAGNPATKVVSDYRIRVTDDGGIAEALGCLQASIYKLMVS